MAPANVSAHGEMKPLSEFLCSLEVTDDMKVHLRRFAVLHSFLSFTASVGNAIALIAFQKVSSMHAPSKLLFRSLAMTDMGVGMIAEPTAVVALVSTYKDEIKNICVYASYARFCLSYTLCMVSLLTSTSINVDRLLALSLRLRYRQVVSLRRVYLSITIFWVLSIVFTALSFVSNTVASLYASIVLSSCVLVSILSYTKIFRLLRQNQVDTRISWQRQPNHTALLNAVLYRKTVFVVVWVQLTLLVCYMPYGITFILVSRREPSLSTVLVWRYAAILLFLNSSLNPVLYYWKMKAVKKAIKETVREVFCW